MTPLSIQSFCKTMLPLIHQKTDGTRILDDAATIVETDRWNSFDRFHYTTRTLVERYESGGAQTEVYEAQTGGAIDTGRWIIQEASDILNATVDIVSPIKQQLLDYQKNPWHVIQWTGGTSQDGVTCELVIVDTLEELDSTPRGRLTGKIILTKLVPRGLLRKLDDTGAVGVITDSPQTHMPDATPWVKFGWGQVGRSEDPARLVGLVLSENEGNKLRSLVMQCGVLKLHVRVDVRRYLGTHDVVSGIVPGREDPQDEVWVLAHSAEPGAVDNASGVSVCLEIARVLERLIADGKIKRPRRSIRFLNAYECYGFFHYMEHVHRLQAPLAGVCLDTLGTKPEYCDGRLSWRATIPMSAGFVDRLGEKMLQASLDIKNPGYTLHTGGFVSTSDTLVGDPKYGFPCPWLNTHYRDAGVYHAYHSSADTTELLSPDGLATCAAAIAGYLYYLADMGSTEIIEIAALETARTVDLLQAGVKGSQSGLGASTGHVRGTSGEQGTRIERLTPTDAVFLCEAHRTSVDRLRRWLWGGDRNAVLTEIAQNKKRVAAAADPFGRTRNTTMPGADRIPYRTAFLSPSLANVPTDIAEQIGSAKLPDWALFWADGHRTISEIASLLSCEHQQDIEPTQVIPYFKGLESLGYIKLIDPEDLIPKKRIVDDLLALGLKAGMDVMVHSSLSSLGYVAGGADAVVDALLEAIGPGGTLLMPSFNHRAAEVYNPMTTPTTNGAIPDALWRRPEAARSMHATHPVSGMGPKAVIYCNTGHVDVGIWAPESPIGRLIHGGGYILALGVTHNFTTAYHVAETSVPCGCIDPFGNIDRVVDRGEVREVRGLAFRSGLCPVDPETLHGPLRKRGLERFGKVAKADASFVKAIDLWEVHREKLVGKCPNCAVKPTIR